MQLQNTMEPYHQLDVADARVFAPAASRNKQPICDVVSRLLSPSSIPTTASGSLAGGLVLEVACGTGEHCAALAQALPGLSFQPTDCTQELFASVEAHSAGLGNVFTPRLIDAAKLPEQCPTVLQTTPSGDAPETGLESVEGLGTSGRGSSEAASLLLAMICINMTHISPYQATLGLLEGAGMGGWMYGQVSHLRMDCIPNLTYCPHEWPFSLVL